MLQETNTKHEKYQHNYIARREITANPWCTLSKTNRCLPSRWWNNLLDERKFLLGVNDEIKIYHLWTTDMFNWIKTPCPPPSPHSWVVSVWTIEINNLPKFKNAFPYENTVTKVSIFRQAIIKKIALNMFLRCSTIVTPIMVGIIRKIISEAGYKMLTLTFCEKVILFDCIGQSMYWSYSTKNDGSQLSHTKPPYRCHCYRLSGRSVGLSLLRRSRSRWVWTLFPSPYVITSVIEYLFFQALINNSAATWKERFFKDCPINFLFLETGAWVFGLCSIESFSPLFFYCLY